MIIVKEELASGFLTLLGLLRLGRLRQEELGRGLEGVARHQNQLLELQQLLDVLQHRSLSARRLQETHLKRGGAELCVPAL